MKPISNLVNSPIKSFLAAAIFLTMPIAASAGYIGQPRDFSFGSDGALYLSQGPAGGASGFEGIARLDAAGQTTAYGNSMPLGVAAGPVFLPGGNYVAPWASGSSTVATYTPSGALASSFYYTTSTGTVFGNYGGIALLPNGNLIVLANVSQGAGTVGILQEYTTSGVRVRETLLTAEFNGAKLALNSSGAIFVATGIAVYGYDSNLTQTSVLVPTNGGNSILSGSLRGFNIDPQGNYLFTFADISLTQGSFSKYSLIDGLVAQAQILSGIPAAVIGTPSGTLFNAGDYFIGVYNIPSSGYGSILNFSNTLELKTTYSGEFQGIAGVPSGATAILVLAGLFVLLGISRRNDQNARAL